MLAKTADQVTLICKAAVGSHLRQWQLGACKQSERIMQPCLQMEIVYGLGCDLLEILL